MPARNRHPNEVSRRSHGDRQMLRRSPAEGNPNAGPRQELTEVRDLGRSPERIRKELSEPTDQRIFYTVKALKSGFSIEEVSNLVESTPGSSTRSEHTIDEDESQAKRLITDTIRDAKILGFSDARIGRLIGKSTENIREFRKSKGVVPFTSRSIRSRLNAHQHNYST